LLSKYNLRTWRFTDEVLIDQDSIPHSHPILTLHTRRHDDAQLLATYLHEQLHWFWLAQPEEKIERALAALREAYPSVQVGFPKGADSELSTYVHYIICYLEYRGLCQVMGEDVAREVVEFWQHDHYTEIYRTLMQDMKVLERIVQHNGLLPPSLSASPSREHPQDE
jgi:hypothetical protein